MKSIKPLMSMGMLLPLLATGASQAQSPVAANADAQSCAALAGKTLGKDTVVQNAIWMDQGGALHGVTVSAPFCRVVGLATPTSDSRIGFEVWLPARAAWNGKFRGEGSGGSAGALSPGPMRDALLAGYATMSTDNGHLNDPKDPQGGSGQRWAFRHPEKMIDWGWRALHLSTVGAKQAVHGFYGKPSSQNYFVSCSAGGHHALMEATRFPHDYDGLVGGAAPWKWTSLMFGHTWNVQPGLKDKSAITPDSVAILNRRMVQACDTLDGLEDGLIADPRRCTVDPVQFQCRSGETANCLTPVQVAAAQHVYRGATKSDGTRLMPGQARGTELGWPGQMAGATPGGSSWEFWKLTVFQDESFDNAKFDFDRDVERALATKVSSSTLPQVYDQSVNFDAFAARGGKFILFQGWSDSVITPLMDVDYTNRVIARYGQKKTDDFFRFFLLPGMGHCSGGPGFGHIGGATGTPAKDDADHDMVKALDRWVTQGEAPSLFIAAQRNAAKEITATRPVCRYPFEARYTGRGNPREAANFTCKMTETLPPQPM